MSILRRIEGLIGANRATYGICLMYHKICFLVEFKLLVNFLQKLTKMQNFKNVCENFDKLFKILSCLRIF